MRYFYEIWETQDKPPLPSRTDSNRASKPSPIVTPTVQNCVYCDFRRFCTHRSLPASPASSPSGVRRTKLHQQAPLLHRQHVHHALPAKPATVVSTPKANGLVSNLPQSFLLNTLSRPRRVLEIARMRNGGALQSKCQRIRYDKRGQAYQSSTLPTFNEPKLSIFLPWTIHLAFLNRRLCSDDRPNPEPPSTRPEILSRSCCTR
jgi:hypothetical protein